MKVILLGAFLSIWDFLQLLRGGADHQKLDIWTVCQLLLTVDHLMLTLSGMMWPGAASLAAAMPSSSPLELLDLSDNDIGPSGAAALADALERGLLLKALRMRGNRIGDEGAAALGRALAKGPLLQELDVGGNQVLTVSLPPLAAPLASLYNWFK